MKVTIIGAGYVGLLSGVCLASKGHEVTCVDVNAPVIQKINGGRPPFYEAGLEELLQRVLAADQLRATTDLVAALEQTDLVLIAVGTPCENEVIDLSFVLAVARSIGSYLKDHDRYLSVVLKSTVTPGTTDTAVRSEIEAASGREFPSFGLGMTPEFLREGDAIADFMEPDRLVLGYEDERTLRLLEELYAPWATDKIRVNTRTAEMIKYANNVLLATQISAINELANLATVLGGIDMMDVVEGVHLDKRWNPLVEGRRVSPGILSYLVPGCGFGGSCFPKDLTALRSHGLREGLPMHMLNAVLETNEMQPRQVVETVINEAGTLEGKTVMVLGLAFKPGTDDIRESASLKIVRALLSQGAHVVAHDPEAADNFRSALGKEADSVIFLDAWPDHVGSADIIIVATAWPEYRRLPEADLSGKLIYDARRMFQPVAFPTARYLSVGRRMRGMGN